MLGAAADDSETMTDLTCTRLSRSYGSASSIGSRLVCVSTLASLALQSEHSRARRSCALSIHSHRQEHTETLLDEPCEAQPAPPSWSGEAPRLLSEDDAVAANARRRDGLHKAGAHPRARPETTQQPGTNRSAGTGLRGPGFFHVVNHGVPRHVIDAFEAATRAFFALPTDVKRRVKRTATKFARLRRRRVHETDQRLQRNVRLRPQAAGGSAR